MNSRLMLSALLAAINAPIPADATCWLYELKRLENAGKSHRSVLLSRRCINLILAEFHLSIEQALEFGRNMVASMVAKQDESSPALPVQDPSVRHFWGDCDASVTRTSTSIAMKLLSGPE